MASGPPHICGAPHPEEQDTQDDELTGEKRRVAPSLRTRAECGLGARGAPLLPAAAPGLLSHSCVSGPRGPDVTFIL